MFHKYANAAIDLHEQEEQYRRIVDKTREGIWVFGPDTTTTFVNARTAELMGCAPAEMIGRPVTEFMFPEDVAKFRAHMAARRRGKAEDYELRLRRTDGRPLWTLVSATPLMGGDGKLESVYAMISDITKRKEMEQALCRSEEQYRALVENLPDLIVRYDKELRRIYVNSAWEKASGLNADEVVNLPANAIPKVPQPTNEKYVAALREVLATGNSQSVEFSWVNALGVKLDLQYIIVPEFDAHGNVGGLLSVGRDISDLIRTEHELQQRETRLRRVNRVLGTLTAGNQVLMRATSEQELLDDMCRVVVETGGHALAWIGCMDTEKHTVGLKSWASSGDMRLWPCAVDGSCGAVATVIHDGRPLVTHDITADPNYALCRSKIVASGARSALTVPVKANKTVLGAISIYSVDDATFDEDEVALFTELADDLGYGISNLRARLEREESQRHLQSSMEATIQALASIAELRDPYTAGHQRRVAQLAVAIAEEMGMASGRVRGLYLASVCHDIGKVQVPAEILSKPGRLTPIEFELIKGHVDAGYDILKSIDFPWPIANIVRQHHERLDGSGYPLGLAGDALLPEARILAVADVVEAIMTHRPYRPGLGLDFALHEITEGRGTTFDAEVVDTCVRVFKEKGFAFDSKKTPKFRSSQKAEPVAL